MHFYCYPKPLCSLCEVRHNNGAFNYVKCTLSLSYYSRTSVSQTPSWEALIQEGGWGTVSGHAPNHKPSNPQGKWLLTPTAQPSKGKSKKEIARDKIFCLPGCECKRCWVDSWPGYTTVHHCKLLSSKFLPEMSMKPKQGFGFSKLLCHIYCIPLAFIKSTIRYFFMPLRSS